MPESEICIKQANRENDWWVCSTNEAQNVHKLLGMIKKSGKKEKLVYENMNGDKIVLEGSNDKDIILYKENEPSVKRQIIPLKTPSHKGFDVGKSKSKSSTKSKDKPVTMRMHIHKSSHTKKSKRKTKKSKKTKKW